MTGTEVRTVEAWEVFDSRGDPTVRVHVETAGGSGVFTVPSGASTGRHEALERRDGGDRYGGKGVREAVAAVESELAPVVLGRDASAQRRIDELLVERDGTADCSNLGANAILGVSGAVAHAAADTLDVSLYEYLAPGMPGDLPLPMVNLISGGLHAHGGIEIQDFLVVPMGAGSYSEALRTAWEVRTATRDLILDRGERPLVADEGGFSPPVESIERTFDLLLEGIREAGYTPGEGIAVALDVAATHFYDSEDGTYTLDGTRLDREDLIDRFRTWLDSYPIVSIEDPLAEDDWVGWQRLAGRIGDEVQLLGDDLLVTDEDRVVRAHEDGAANAVLVKPNQTGTLTRAIDVIERANEAGMATVVSARSGETCDSTIADLAVALDAGQIKIGSLARSERLAKYNRLLEIEREVDGFAGTSALAP